MNPTQAETALRILRHRAPFPTDAILASGARIRIFNVAWGRDLGDEYDHVTTNISPPSSEELPIDFFYTHELVKLLDPETGHTIWSRDEGA